MAVFRAVFYISSVCITVPLIPQQHCCIHKTPAHAVATRTMRRRALAQTRKIGVDQAAHYKSITTANQAGAARGHLRRRGEHFAEHRNEQLVTKFAQVIIIVVDRAPIDIAETLAVSA